MQSQKASIAQSLVGIAVAIASVIIVVLTNFLDSPAIFLLYVALLLLPVSSPKTVVIIVALIETVGLVAALVSIPGFYEVFNLAPLKIVGLIFSPLIVAYLLIRIKDEFLKKEIENSKAKADAAKVIQLAQFLANEKTKLEEILQGIQYGVIIANEKGLVSSANRKALEILNTAAGIILNKPIKKVLPLGKINLLEHTDFELELESLEGEKVFTKVQIFPLLSVKGELKGTIFIIRDITKEKEFEEMKLDFVAMAAHQLRTPLTSIRGYLSILTDSANDKLNDEEKMFLSRSIVSTRQLSSLIENLLSVTKVERGRLNVNINPFSMEKVIGEVIEALNGAAMQKNLKLIFEKPPSPYPMVLGDSSMIHEVLVNLVSNGIEYNHEGGWVMVTVQQAAKELVVHVTDSGKGIPLESIPRLFQKFYKVPNNLGEASHGAGLGLYITKQIMDAHKGKITVSSIEGKGTTFSFYLPVVNAGVS